MFDISPIYADGPLKDRDCAVPGSAHPLLNGVEAIDGESRVHYRLRKFMIFGRGIWIASVKRPDELTDAELFDVLISDRAKQACEPIHQESGG